MILVYIYMLATYPVKSRVNAVGSFWLTIIGKLGLPEFFPYFLSNINKLN